MVKNPPANAGDVGSISGSGRSLGVGNGSSLWYSCLVEIPWTEEPGGLQSMGLWSQTWQHSHNAIGKVGHDGPPENVSGTDIGPYITL